MIDKKCSCHNCGITILLVIMVLCLNLFAGCGSSSTTSTPTNTSTSGTQLKYVDNPLPTWTAGKFNTALLSATGGVSPYTWTLKDGSQLPEGFQLYTDGKLTGTPPLLPAGTTILITPPFTIVITDSAGNKIEVELRVTIVQQEEPVYSLTININSPEGGRVTQSSSPDPGGFHFGDLVMLTATPEEGWVFDGWDVIGLVINDLSGPTINFSMPENDVTIYAVFNEQTTEIFTGSFETVMGEFGTSNGCLWDQYISGLIIIRLDSGSENTVSGTVEFDVDLYTVSTITPANITCSTYVASLVVDGELSGTITNFGGDYENESERPLFVLMSASKNGDEITCHILFTKTFITTVNGVIESYPQLNTEITVVLTKES
jgi:hypothetical protein